MQLCLEKAVDKLENYIKCCRNTVDNNFHMAAYGALLMFMEPGNVVLWSLQMNTKNSTYFASSVQA